MSARTSSQQTRKAQSTVDTDTPELRCDSVIAAIPCYNEELYIGSVVLKAAEYVDRVLVIDDGSTDATGLIAERAGAVVVRHDCNKGKGAAVNTAFSRAKELGCSALVLLDGDGQHDPSYIPSLIKPVLDGDADMVVGSRYLRDNNGVPRYRVWGHRVLTLFTNMGSRISVTDSQSGFRAFSSKAVESLTFAEQGLSVESEMQFLASQSNLRVSEVHVTVGYHQAAKRNPIGHGLGVLNSVIGFISRRAPLFFFGAPGLIMLLIGLWQGWRVVDAYNAGGGFNIGPALITVLLCIIGSLALFTGLILHNIKSLLR